MAAARGDSSISGPGGRHSALAWALAASVALHAVLIFGVAVRPGPSAVKRSPVIAARLEQAPGTLAPLPGRAEPPIPHSGAIFRPAPHPEAVLRPAPLEKPVAEASAAVAADGAPAVPNPPAVNEAAAKPALDIPLLEDPAYYPARQLDVPPIALQPVKPAYPEAAVAAGVEGMVTLQLLIDELGRVREASVVEARPEGYFEESALRASRGALFSPARREGRIVKSRVVIKVRYQLGQ